MVDFDWSVDDVRATILLGNLSQSWNIECRIVNILFLFNVNPYLNSKHRLLASQCFFTGFGFITFRLFNIFYYRWWWVIPSIVLTEWYETRALQVYVNGMFAQWVFFHYSAVIDADRLFLIMLGRLNTRARFRAMAEASIPLSSFSLGETSSSQPTSTGDRELRSVGIWFLFCIIKDANFCYFDLACSLIQ